MVIRETTGGSNITVTVASGTYTSDAAFFAAVKAALDLAGDSTYTVDRDPDTLKIRITSNGVGGAGHFEIRWGTQPEMGTTLGFDTSDDSTGLLSYTADILRIHTAEWIRFDLGVSSTPQAIVLAGLRNAPIRLTDSALIKLQGNHTDTWTSPAVELTLDYDENAIAAFDDDGLHTSALRYWRLYIEDPSNPLGYIELSNIYLGETYSPERGRAQFPLDASFVDYSEVTRAESGNAFSNRRNRTQEFGFSWRFLTKEENEVLSEFVEEVGLSYPFFISLDPEAQFSSSPSKWVRIARFTQLPVHRLESPNNWIGEWNMREEI